jgi:hypothetical protein
MLKDHSILGLRLNIFTPLCFGGDVKSVISHYVVYSCYDDQQLWSKQQSIRVGCGDYLYNHHLYKKSGPIFFGNRCSDRFDNDYVDM